MKLHICLVACLAGFSVQSAPAGLVVHEWGTFTSLQDESGTTIGGINTDDEPVPHFVHRMAQLLLLSPTEVPPPFFQGAPRCHPDVTMRLETPVIYFHPSAKETALSPIDVRVKFRGGWLTEFFPKAEVQAPGLQENGFKFGPLPPDTLSELNWKGVRLGGEFHGPATTDHVWLSPRAVQAASVETCAESEKFLFYRGVGNIAAPLRVSRDQSGQMLALRGQQTPELQCPLPISALWLTEIRPEGEVAFRTLKSIALNRDANEVLLRTPAAFAEKEFSKKNMTGLRSALQAALIEEGLFQDEALALLNTWELSYFKSPGLRLFFLVPRTWTDHYLPLELSQPAEINRVMVGRIELVTRQQRKLLRMIAAQSAKENEADLKKLHTDIYGAWANKRSSVEMPKVNEGRSRLSNVGITVPLLYQAYLDLGRFRNALVLDELHRNPKSGLKSFVEMYRLQGYNAN
jgi:hypothetical protein